jgi:hypothetical protein
MSYFMFFDIFTLVYNFSFRDKILSHEGRHKIVQTDVWRLEIKKWGQKYKTVT